MGAESESGLGESAHPGVPWLPRPLARLSQRLRVRIEETIAERGLVYPWWIPAVSIVGQTGAVLGALALRDALWRPGLAWLTVVLVLAPGTAMLLGRRVPHWLEDLTGLLAAAWLFAIPLTVPGTLDPTPALLGVLTAAVVAREGLRPGLAMAAISMGMIAVVALGPGLSNATVHVLDVVLGAVIGSMLRYQMRALIAERIAREGERARATLAERERIAREIHDLVAHSLSVTLLQITGARHALADLDGDAEQAGADLEEIDAALADAEQVSRQAMADIRHTVSTLADGPGPTGPLPGGADILTLVEQMQRAGLAIAFQVDGDPGRLAQAAGLGLYRIAQESLANVAKHAPGQPVRVQLLVSPRVARLSVANPIGPGPVPHGGTRPAGSGLVGMRARAEQLGARLRSGLRGGEWVVEVELPLTERHGQLVCPRKAWRLAW